MKPPCIVLFELHLKDEVGLGLVSNGAGFMGGVGIYIIIKRNIEGFKFFVILKF